MNTANFRGRKVRRFSLPVLYQHVIVSHTHLMVYPLVDFLFVVQHDKRLGGDGIAVEDETEVTALTLHVCEVYQGSVQSVHTHTNMHIQRVGLVWEL